MSIHLFCGNLYLWGNIAPYVISYYHHLGDENANSKTAISVIPLSITVLSFFNPLGAYLMKKYHPKLVLAMGAALMVLGVFLASIVRSWWLFVGCYSGIFSMGAGLIYWTPVICGWEWFPKRRGLISGLIIGAFGFGAFIFGFISTALVNPGNKYEADKETKLFPKEVSDNVPFMFQVCLSIWTVLAIIGVALISRDPNALKSKAHYAK